MRVRPVIKPPWAEKRPDRHSELSLNEDSAGAEGSAESNSVLSKEQLKALRSQQGWPHFKDVFMLSSVDREDVDTLKVRAPAVQFIVSGPKLFCSGLISVHTDLNELNRRGVNMKLNRL